MFPKIRFYLFIGKYKEASLKTLWGQHKENSVLKYFLGNNNQTKRYVIFYSSKVLIYRPQRHDEPHKRDPPYENNRFSLSEHAPRLQDGLRRDFSDGTCV